MPEKRTISAEHPILNEIHFLRCLSFLPWGTLRIWRMIRINGKRTHNSALNVELGILFVALPTPRDSYTFHLRREGVLEQSAHE